MADAAFAAGSIVAAADDGRRCRAMIAATSLPRATGFLVGAIPVPLP
jgi:hypothetical protein